MIKIEIKEDKVLTRSGNKNGRDWTMRTQEAWAHTVSRNGQPNAYPEKITITLEQDQPPYQQGNYQLMPASLWVGDYGSLRLGNPVLQPIAIKQVQAA